MDLLPRIVKEAVKKNMAMPHGEPSFNKAKGTLLESSFLWQVLTLSCPSRGPIKPSEGIFPSMRGVGPMMLQTFAKAKLYCIEEYKSSANFKEKLMDASIIAFI